ncbi:MAG: hypothetical protein ACI88G_002049, partial [Woeseiaceae bacterium]
PFLGKENINIDSQQCVDRIFEELKYSASIEYQGESNTVVQMDDLDCASNSARRLWALRYMRLMEQ